MRVSKATIGGMFFFFLPDVLILIFLYHRLAEQSNSIYHPGMIMAVIAGVLGLLAFKTIVFMVSVKYFYFNRLAVIKEIIDGFRKGRFKSRIEGIVGHDIFARILKELVMAGKYLDNMVTAQRSEIDTFHEFYNSIVFSISSFFIVLGEDDRIVYANEGFCKKFNMQAHEVVDHNIEEIFYFVNARLKGALLQVKKQGKPIVLEQTHLLSVNRVSIIADIKISKIMVRGKNQTIIILDDVTGKLRKDYQMSLMSHISGTFQKDIEIERVLYTILTGVTSGSGLGFNRAQFFLVDRNRQYLEGKMAVGPDSIEEAIGIWSALSVTGMHLQEPDGEQREGRLLLKKVQETRYELRDDNIFTRSLKNGEIIHVYDSWSDNRVEPGIRAFMDVKEFVVVPVIAINNQIGILAVDNKFNQIPIGKESIELLTMFAAQAALSIESHNNLVMARREKEKLEKRQDAIIESEKMAAVGRIAAHISHEIRNPLVTMGGYARRISLALKQNPVVMKDIDKYSTIIFNESERLEKILSNVMDFTRPSKFIKELNNINDIVADTVNLLQNMFLEKRLEVVLKLDRELPFIKSDFNQMKQVMLNLLQNAMEFTEPEGIIEVVTEYTEQSVIIKVRDTGSGIDEDDPTVVFEPFFTKKISGVGLGLANVKKIITDHDGTIEVRNREYGGAEFKIAIPLP